MKISPLANALKEYRAAYKVTQEKLAEALAIDVRTLRRWENSDTILKDVDELARIAARLGIDAALLGVVIPDTLLLVRARDTIEHAWNLKAQGRMKEARAVAEQTVLTVLSGNVRTDERVLVLAHAYHLQGFLQASSVLSNDVAIPLKSYLAMEIAALEAGNMELLALARTYAGDMYRRVGQIDTALEYFQGALASIDKGRAEERGNAVQLQARAYFKRGDKRLFEDAMCEAEYFAYQLENEHPVTRGQFGLKSVWEEWAKSYALEGRIQEALDYIERARNTGPITPHWDAVLLTTETLAYIYGNEFEQGAKLAVEAVHYCRMYGVTRLLERLYTARKYVDSRLKNVRNARDMIQEALDGTVEG